MSTMPAYFEPEHRLVHSDTVMKELVPVRVKVPNNVVESKQPRYANPPTVEGFPDDDVVVLSGAAEVVWVLTPFDTVVTTVVPFDGDTIIEASMVCTLAVTVGLATASVVVVVEANALYTLMELISQYLWRVVSSLYSYVRTSQ